MIIFIREWLLEINLVGKIRIQSHINNIGMFSGNLRTGILFCIWTSWIIPDILLIIKTKIRSSRTWSRCDTRLGWNIILNLTIFIVPITLLYFVVCIDTSFSIRKKLEVWNHKIRSCSKWIYFICEHSSIWLLQEYKFIWSILFEWNLWNNFELPLIIERLDNISLSIVLMVLSVWEFEWHTRSIFFGSKYKERSIEWNFIIKHCYEKESFIRKNHSLWIPWKTLCINNYSRSIQESLRRLEWMDEIIGSNTEVEIIFKWFSSILRLENRSDDDCIICAVSERCIFWGNHEVCFTLFPIFIKHWRCNYFNLIISDSTSIDCSGIEFKSTIQIINWHWKIDSEMNWFKRRKFSWDVDLEWCCHYLTCECSWERM